MQIVLGVITARVHAVLGVITARVHVVLGVIIVCMCKIFTESGCQLLIFVCA